MATEGSKLEARLIADQPSRTIKILLDARKIKDGGIGTYIRNLTAGLLEVGGTDVSLICRKRDIEDYSWADKIGVIEDNAPLYSLDELFRMPKRINFSDFDLFHCPHYTLPYGIPIPKVVTIHDLIHISHPQRFYYPIVASTLIRSAIKRSDQVITVSQSTLDQISKLRFGVSRDLSKINIVPNAIDSLFFEVLPSASYVSSKFGLDGPYFLSVLSMDKPHKGINDLLQAFKTVKESNLTSSLVKRVSSLRLVLVGKGSEGIVNNDALLPLIASVPGIHLMGHLSKEDLIQLYANASALIVPSVAEGFSVPVIEAQAVETPVVARPVPAIIELMNSSDIVCKDFSLPALINGMSSALSRFPNTKRTQTKEKLREHLSKFTCECVARATLDVYRKIPSPLTATTN